MQVRQQCPDPEQRDRNLSGQPLVTMGGGALPLPMPTQPATLTATRVATKATSTFFIGVPLSFTPRDSHFVPRCTVSRPLNPMVHRLRRQWGTSKGTVSLGTQLRGVRSKTCQKAAANRPPGTHHSPSISGLNSSSSALRLDRLLRLRWLTARCPTPSHLALHGRTTSAYHSSRWVVQHSKIPRLRSESGHSRPSQAGPLAHPCPQHPDSDRKFKARLFVAMCQKRKSP